MECDTTNFYFCCQFHLLTKEPDIKWSSVRNLKICVYCLIGTCMSLLRTLGNSCWSVECWSDCMSTNFSPQRLASFLVGNQMFAEAGIWLPAPVGDQIPAEAGYALTSFVPHAPRHDVSMCHLCPAGRHVLLPYLKTSNQKSMQGQKLGVFALLIITTGCSNNFFRSFL